MVNILHLRDTTSEKETPYLQTEDLLTLWCVYQNKQALSTTYGKLYNWYAVNSGKLAPDGWHVPSDAEWTALVNFLGGEDCAVIKMKATTSWIVYPGITNTNISGFTAVAAGFRINLGMFNYAGSNAVFWSSTPDGNHAA